jgi:hypothetical protein
MESLGEMGIGSEEGDWPSKRRVGGVKSFEEQQRVSHDAILSVPRLLSLQATKEHIVCIL